MSNSRAVVPWPRFGQYRDRWCSIAGEVSQGEDELGAGFSVWYHRIRADGCGVHCLKSLSLRRIVIRLYLGIPAILRIPQAADLPFHPRTRPRTPIKCGTRGEVRVNQARTQGRWLYDDRRTCWLPGQDQW